MLKDILVPLTDTDADDAALDLAVSIAAACQARVAALVTVQTVQPVVLEWGAIPASVSAEILALERERGQALAARARERLGHVDAAEVRIAESMLPARAVAALHARHADLAVMAAPAGDSRDLMDDMAVDLLMQSGRPLLLVPRGHVQRAAPLHAVIAWQPTREAARAVHDALALLHAYASVDVLLVDPQVRDSGHGDHPGADIAAHLARHGLRVDVVSVPRMGNTVEACILGHVVESGADLVVAGGYSHTRFREQILGGVTRMLLGDFPVPVLLSH